MGKGCVFNVRDWCLQTIYLSERDSKTNCGKSSHCIFVFLAGKEPALVFLDHLLDYKNRQS